MPGDGVGKSTQLLGVSGGRQEVGAGHAEHRPMEFLDEAEGRESSKKRKARRPKQPTETEEAPERKSQEQSEPTRKKGSPQRVKRGRWAFVFADESARRLKPHVLRTTQWNDHVQFKIQQDSTIHEVDGATDIWSVSEAIVVIQAGLSDIGCTDMELNTLVQAFRSKLMKWMRRRPQYHFVFQALPEHSGQDENHFQSLREMEQFDEGCLRRTGRESGVHYHKPSDRIGNAGHRIQHKQGRRPRTAARPATVCFLGLRPSRRFPHDQRPSRHL
ncbi:hypothetical protein HPB48_013198 [Haemaphysalis longicornis]|uniref:Uncharacterized protein n=1 Tax=Haemaphysalis longicornis TaxID=44386 RepID=A0A9J6FEM5_HAELO|nr:hypothetical protein HPB48_013198 [Haemaphysalis longicornis]